MSFSGSFVIRHKKGWTVAVYDVLGERIVSGGLDGKVKISHSLDDPSPLEHVIGERINAIVCRNDTIILATEGTYVHMIQAEDGLPDGVATRFTAEVNDLATNKDMTKLVSCSSDFMIKIVDFNNSSEREFILEGHKAPVLSVSFDPLDIFIASSSCDGTIRIWRVDQRKEVKCVRALSPCTDPTLALSCCRLCWQSISGQFLAVPIDKEVCLYERDSWEVLAYLTCPSITKPIMVCASSPSGSRLAAGCGDGWIVIWAVEDRCILNRVKDSSESPICSLSWHPHQETSLLVANQNGCLGLVRLPGVQLDGEGLSPRSMNALLGCDEDGDTDELLRAAAAQAESSRLIDEDDLIGKNAETDGDSADDDVHSIDLSKIKSGFMDLDDLDSNALEVNNEKVIAAASVQQACVLKADAALMQQLPGLPSEPSYPVNQFQQAFQPGSMPLGFRERFMVWNRYGLVIQYRSTDADPHSEYPSDLDRPSSGSIEVEFHDTTIHHSLRFNNATGYTMADLSLTALLLATPGIHDPTLADEADVGDHFDHSDISQIAVLPLDTSVVGSGDSSSEWTIKLPPGEACEAVCLVPNDQSKPDHTEPGYAVVATSRRFLRVFAQPTSSAALARTLSNLHLFQITKLGIPPVSLPYYRTVAMASHPSKPILGVIVTSVTGELMWRLFYLGGIMLGCSRSRYPSWLSESLVTWQPLPISLSPPRPSSRTPAASMPAKLTWFGFSDFGGLYTHDASGIVRRLMHGRQGDHREYFWAPVCDTRTLLKPSNRRSDNYFIVGMLESSEAPVGSLTADHLTRPSENENGLGQIQAIYCKASRWPRVFPRPVVCSLPFRLPLCAMDTDQGILEDNYLRYLISEDWPVWGPNPRYPLCTVDAAEVDFSDLFQAISSKCKKKRSAVLLRLFALAAKLESDWASLAIARLMPDAATVQLAIRYAGRLRRQHLAHRLAGIALEKECRDDTAIQNSESTEEDHESNSDHRSQQLPQKVTHSRNRPTVGPSGGTEFQSRRYPPGSHEENVTNVSLVSSATDDTHDEEHINGLPLPESEPVTQSFLSSALSTGRNPFRDSASLQKAALRSRGSEVLDSWQPELSASANTAYVDTLDFKMTKNSAQSRKRRAAPTQTEKRHSKMAKPSSSLNTDDLEGFMEWFDTNRQQLEGEHPGQSAEELLKIARKFFKREKPTIVENSDEKENKEAYVSDGPSSKVASKRQAALQFTEKAAKRLSSFKFESNDDGS